MGDPYVVRRLLDAGADPSGWRTDAQHVTPLAVASFGSRNHRAPGRDYVAVAEMLTAAGNEVEPQFLEVAEGPLYDWLEARTESEE
jgi:hypothetical protein